MQRVTPFLWFDSNAEEAVNFYVSIFPNSRIVSTNRYGEEAAKASGRAAGSVMTMSFVLNGQEFIALNGGPMFKFTEAISFLVNCDSQEEVDHFWEKLFAGGQPGPCGWLKDRFGLSWQIFPVALGKMLSDPDTAKSRRVMQALLKMGKLDIAQLKQAYEG